MALFVGTYDRKLDGKARVVIPAGMAATIQSESGGRLYLVPSADNRFLEAYPARKFEAMAKDHAPDRFARSPDSTRKFFPSAREVDIKGPGRITIPKKDWIKDYFPAGVVRVAGMADYLELWDPKRFEDAIENDPAEQAGFQSRED